MLIESEDLLTRIEKCYQESAKTGLGLEPVMAIRDIKALISVMTEVDAAPVVHAQWELVDEAEPQRYGCSKCSCLSWYGMYNYCPNCGAKMDLEG